MTDHTRLLVKNILGHPGSFKWSVQGLGMLRTYLSQEVRLHVWDSSLKVAGASPYHNHPWDLDSLIVAGRYKQHRYASEGNHRYPRQEFNCAEIKCGEGAHPTEQSTKVVLVELPLETYEQGQSYHQDKEEIHLSCPEDGTVTIVTRTFHEDRDHAKVLWRGKGAWVDAEPRDATQKEIVEVTTRALETWF